MIFEDIKVLYHVNIKKRRKYDMGVYTFIICPLKLCHVFALVLEGLVGRNLRKSK